MKHIIYVMALCVVFTACKNKSKSTQNTEAKTVENSETETLKTLTGNYTYYADAAVLQVNNSIYSVVLNNLTTQLNKKAEPLKKEATDAVKVTIKAEVMPKPKDEEGWPFRVNIKEIINVEALPKNTNEVIKID